MFRRLNFLLAFFFIVSPVYAARTDIDAPITKKVMVLIFNTVLENQGGVKLYDYMRWNNPDTLIQEYIQEITSLSGGYLNYQVVARHEIDDYPIKGDGFQYTDETYLACMSNSALCHKPDLDNYNILLTKYMDICAKHNNNEFDEILMVGAPWFGFYEAVMTGPGAFWTNGGPITGTSCQRKLNIMGFVPDRTVSEMLEDMGHRFEGTMKYVYGSWEKTATHAWNRFTLIDKYNPGQAACGYVHYGPNSQSDYNWVNQTTVVSSCDDWLNYPNLTGFQETFNCVKWGCTGLGYKKWWLNHIPKYKGLGPDGKLLNWWHYVVDFDDAKEMEQVMSESVAPKGYHDGAFPDVQCAVYGWTCDPDDFSKPLSVRFYEGSTLVGETVANSNREQAVGDLCGGYTNRGFLYTFSMDSALRDGGTHTITAKAMDIDRLGRETMRPFDLATNPQVITCPVRPAPTATPTHTPVPTHTLAPLAGDETGDGKVNVSDLLAILRSATVTNLIFRYSTVVAQYGRSQ